MAKETESSSGEPRQIAPKSELPNVESPSISPATPEPAIEPAAEAFPVIEPITEATSPIAPAGDTPATPARFTLRPRHKRYALLAASVALAAAFGAVIGAMAGGGFSASAPPADIASIDERKAMRKSIGELAKEVTTLKTSLEAANKSAHAQIAKISERIDRNASAELVTGSISPPQTMTPVPTPRPAPRIAAVDTQPPARPPLVQGWWVREARDGFVYVESHGDIYQVVPGAPLPGLGPVESVKREDGHWVVTTPRGIIVSMRDRRRFE